MIEQAIQATGASGMQDMGKVMGQLKPRCRAEPTWGR